MPEMTLSDLCALVGGQCEGDGARVVRGVAPIESAGGDEVTFLSNVKYEKHVARTGALAVIVPADYAGPRPPAGTLIRSQDSYFAFRQAMVAFYGFRQHPFEGIDERAIIDPSATLAEGVRVGPLAVISRDVTIGPNTVIYPGAFIGPRTRIGSDCILYPNVTLYDGSVLGDRVTVHAGSSIGHDGFGYATHRGRHEKIPQVGWVELGDDVEIGACCTIDRAAMGPTVIGAGTKFSNLIAIGHGTRLGEHCLLVAQTGIAGSVTIGKYCVFGGQSGVAGHTRLGDGVRVAGRGGAISDTPAGTSIGSMPGMPLAEARRYWVTRKHLPEMRNEIKRLRRELDDLKRQLAPSPPPPGGDA